MIGLHVDVHLEGRGCRYAFDTDATVTGVFGRSGAGKTTLLHAIAGLVDGITGVIRVGDDTLLDSERRVNVPTHKRRVGVVFQDDRLLPHLTVERNLRYGMRGEATDGVASFDDTVALLDLGSLLRRRPRSLSGGERQRVAIGRALLTAPRLLLLDEPLSSIDKAASRQIMTLIARIRDTLDLSMLFVSHDLGELLQMTDRLLVVDEGRTVGHGPLASLVRETAAWRAVRALGPLNVVRGVVAGHDRAAGLTTIRLGDDSATADLMAPLADLDGGAIVHVAVRPEDIALAADRVEGISIQNQIPGTVRDVTTHHDRAVTAIDIGPTTWLVEVSHRTVASMQLAPGRAVRCLIKSNAVRYAD